MISLVAFWALCWVGRIWRDFRGCVFGVAFWVGRIWHDFPGCVLGQGSVWIPALSAVGDGFAIGLAATGSGLGQGIASRRCLDGISRQPEVADDLRGVLLLSLAFMESLTIYGLVIALVLLFANPLIK